MNAAETAAASAPKSAAEAVHKIARESALLRKANAASAPPFFAAWLNTGTIALESAPSPKSLRMRFGRLNANVYALLTAPMLMYAMESESLTSPKMREPTVAKATFIMFFSLPTV